MQVAGIQVASAGAAAASLSQSFNAMAGPFTADGQSEHLIPADKKLTPEWLESLSQRGEPEVYRGDQLRYIGMPVGGICCGQLYLGGDGRLWLWDIFQSQYQSDYGGMSMGTHYAKPPVHGKPERYRPVDVAHGFAIRLGIEGGETQIRTLDHEGFREVTFRGEYPIGRVTYRDDDCPVEIELEAFSPFIPLDAADSALPATVMSFKLHNYGKRLISVEIIGHLQNSVCPDFDSAHLGQRVNQLERSADRCTIMMTARSPAETDTKPREDIEFSTFEGDQYDGWKAHGTAFGKGPLARADMPDYLNVLGHEGKQVINSHNTRNGEDTAAGDKHTGTLTSEQFSVKRKFINFRIGGGKHPGKTCLNLLIDGKIVRSATGHNANRMRAESFDVTELQEKKGKLQIVDAVEGGWGNIGIDHITFSDTPVRSTQLEELPGYGSMALTLLGEQARAAVMVRKDEVNSEPMFDRLFRVDSAKTVDSEETDLSQKPIGALGTQQFLGAEESHTVDFVISWHFPGYPNVTGEFAAIQDIDKLQRQYASRFENAATVADYIGENFERLAGQTRLWNQTWYDSTLPYWLLDRSFISLDCLATQTCHWFDSGRFYGWEGVTCCPGTCQHVWNYAQGLARIFPELERSTREHVDYGIAFQESGELWYRAESGRHIAHDGQCGTILRAYREHTTAVDDTYLQRIWPKIRQSIQYLIAQDGGKDGLLEGRQYNTLDQAWCGPMGWISSMYLAALEAGRTMAHELNDQSFADRCTAILDSGRQNIKSQLFNGEYFIHKPPNFKATNTNDGCHIDQIFGQSLAWQVGLPRVVSKLETDSALKSLWKYNFAPDAGGYHKTMREGKKIIKAGRWYAMPGEAGLLMCTWPTGGAEHASGIGDEVFTIGVGYFNECMNGFEYQVASHMIYEGEAGSELVTQGLAITRAVHDRYAAEKRNPYNEIECSDHYSRSMASYGVFLATCGFAYHGPTGHIGFSPRLSPDKFKAAFTAAEGWGCYRQQIAGDSLQAQLEVLHGSLRLKTIAITLPGKLNGQNLRDVSVDDEPAEYFLEESRLLVNFGHERLLETGDLLRLVIRWR